MPKRIYIADDDKNIRDLIARFLKNDGFETETFDSGDALLRAFRERPADMLVLDIMMPGTDGLALCAQIRESSDVPIIIVSARDSELDRINGITTGSDDYMVKPFSPMELVTRAKAIFRRTGATRAPVCHELSFGPLRIVEAERQAYLGEEKLDLTPTELSFMAYLIRNMGRAVSREELLRAVWRFEAEVDTRATDDVVKRLRRKLRGSGIRIGSVWGYGFRLEMVTEES